MIPPRDAIAAATHPDPYPYYADLVATRPLYKDDGAPDVGRDERRRGDGDPDLRRLPGAVPPPSRFPRRSRGGPAGRIFRHMIRMNDGAGHCPFKPAMAAALGEAEAGRPGRVALECARLLAEPLGAKSDPRGVTDFGVSALHSRRRQPPRRSARAVGADDSLGARSRPLLCAVGGSRADRAGASGSPSVDRALPVPPRSAERRAPRRVGAGGRASGSGRRRLGRRERDWPLLPDLRRDGGPDRRLAPDARVQRRRARERRTGRGAPPSVRGRDAALECAHPEHAPLRGRGRQSSPGTSSAKGTRSSSSSEPPIELQRSTRIRTAS